MMADRRVPVAWRGQLAGSTACSDCRAMPLSKTPERTIVASERPGVRGIGLEEENRGASTY